MLIRKLFRTAWSYKAQFISMILMIAIGVGVFFGFHMEWKSLETNAFSFMENTHYADFRLYSESGFTEEDAEVIAAIDGVTAATRYFFANVQLKGRAQSVALNVSENYTVSTMCITSGAAYDEQSDGIWLSDKFAVANDITIGDTLTFTYSDIEFSGTVVGLAKSGENLICIADENQLMPDNASFGFAYITPHALKRALGVAFYPQINLRSDLAKETIEERVQAATGTAFLVADKSTHTAYAGVKSESEEGQTMGSILPVLFLAIAVLTMTTTMHRIAAKEKVQIGTLKALGFRDRTILRHYTSYGLLLGLFGLVGGIALGYLIAALVISPHGMMSTYIDMPSWDLVMPAFCLPVAVVIPLLLTLIAYLSVKRMLKGTAADALRPYAPKAMSQSVLEKTPLWKHLPFGIKWNIRDILRHKSRSAMTLIGVIGCTVLLVGGLGMKDTMNQFLSMLDQDICHYTTKLALTESADNAASRKLADTVDGDWQATVGISYEGKTTALEIHRTTQGHLRFLTEKNEPLTLADDGVYLCLRLKDTAKPGDTIRFSPYGSDTTYTVKVKGYLRSLLSECIVMTDTYADSIGLDYHIASVYTARSADDIDRSSFIAGMQDKDQIMDSYDIFLELLDLMVIILIVAAMVLGIVVLYNLGVMSYVERYRELATLKVLGFRDKHIGKLLISQNIWLTVLGVLIGIPAGVGVLYWLLTALASEYELSLYLGAATYTVSIVLTFAVSLLVGLMVARKNKNIDMAEALKGAE